MPPRRKDSSAIARAANAVRQSVNVKVMTAEPARRRRRKRVPAAAAPKAQGMAGVSGALGVFSQRAPVLQTLSSIPVPMQQTAAAVSEYNLILKELAAERAARAAAAAPLQPNTTPLTLNAARNELLSRKPETTPLDEITARFGDTIEKTVNAETADDPSTNENMFNGSSRLAQNIAPKLPLGRIDEADVAAFDTQEPTAQEALVQEVELTAAQKRKKRLAEAYADYADYVEALQERYGLGIQLKPKSKLNSFAAITQEKRRIDELVFEMGKTPKII